METSNLKHQSLSRLWQALVFGFVFLPWISFSQPSLNFFTNRANSLLQQQFGFGLTNIPVYSATNPAIAYSAAIHFALQSAANIYDQTTPDTDFPSVFRPQFSAQSNALFIIGYTNVTTDFDAQIGLGFKDIGDPSIGLNDNVWGIPWVVGMKGHAPAFNEYSYSTACNVTRKLQFTRPTTNQPPQYTNQFYFMSVSNIFAAEAWNFSSTNFSNSITILITNRISVVLTNNYNWGTSFITSNATNWLVNSWPGSPTWHSTNNFQIPLLTTCIPLSPSLWSESAHGFISLSNFITYPASDEHQIGWPEHTWTLNITNHLIYALLDSSTGTNRVLDFVNLGGLGTSMNIIQTLNSAFASSPTAYPNIVWNHTGATDAPNSPMSIGMSNQIQIALGNLAVSEWSSSPQNQVESAIFRAFLLGQSSNTSLMTMCPFDVSTLILAESTWQSGNPLIHYTSGDLIQRTENLLILMPSFFGDLFTNSIGSIGKINPAYLSAKTNLTQPILNNGVVQFNFSGCTNLPYGVWGSTNLSDWVPLGTASQTSPGSFQFTDPTPLDSRSRFYRLQVP